MLDSVIQRLCSILCCVDQLLVRSVGHRGQCAEKICSADMRSYAEGLCQSVPICATLSANVKVVPLGSVRPSLCNSAM